MSFEIGMENVLEDVPRIVEGIVLPPLPPFERRYVRSHLRLVVDLDFFPGEDRRKTMQREFDLILEKCFPTP